MLIIARGWGYAVFYVLAGWGLAAILWVVFFSWYEPDLHKIHAILDRLGAAWLGLSALTLQFIVQYRHASLRRAEADAPPEVIVREREGDDFSFIRLDYWPAILFVFGLGAFAASFFT